MKHPLERLATGLALTGLAMLAIGGLGAAAGIRVNTSPSIPLGFYGISAEPVVRGAYVLVCPPAWDVFEEARSRGYIGAGPCPGGYGYLMKRVLGVSGDDIAVADEGVFINGHLQPRSTLRTRDGAGRPLPKITHRYRLADADLLLMSEASETAFDGRYFGPVPRANVEAVIRPILTW